MMSVALILTDLLTCFNIASCLHLGTTVVPSLQNRQHPGTTCPARNWNRKKFSILLPATQVTLVANHLPINCSGTQVINGALNHLPNDWTGFVSMSKNSKKFTIHQTMLCLFQKCVRGSLIIGRSEMWRSRPGQISRCPPAAGAYGFAL